MNRALTNQQWQAKKLESLKNMSGNQSPEYWNIPGVYQRFDELRTQGEKAAKSIWSGGFQDAFKTLETYGNAESSANHFLRSVVDRMKRKTAHFRFVQMVGPLNLCGTDDEFKDFAEAMANAFRVSLIGAKFPALEYVQVVEDYGFSSDFMRAKRVQRGPNKHKIKEGENWEARVCCPIFWRRQVRKLAQREVEAMNREIGLTNRQAGCYVSEFVFRRWKQSQRRNQLMLEGIEVENDLGQKYTLDKLAGLGVSNPEIRRGELMVRCRGFEEWAEKQGGEFVPMFYTITCPSRFHAFSSGKINDKYDGSTPSQASDYLCNLWSRFRADAARGGLRYFGFRVAEPHHDGCPHWHILLFCSSAGVGAITEGLRKVSFADSPDEAGAKKHRFEAVKIDAKKGSAAGYIAKYISKNIDGYAVGMDEESGKYAESSAPRVKAWASVWGIRQFQQIGGPPVTVWRELRRLARHQERIPGEASRDKTFEDALMSADEGDWCGFVGAMGGATASRAEQPIGIEYADKVQSVGGVRELKQARYGGLVRVIRGIWAHCFPYPMVTRLREWTLSRTVKAVKPSKSIERASKALREASNQIEGFLRAPPALALDLCQ